MRVNGVWPIALALSIAAESISAQDSTDIRFTGSIGASYDMYSMASSGTANTPPRRPTSIFRINADPTLSVGEWLSIPVNISFTFREAAVIQPSLDYPGIMEFLQNPLNRFSIAPRIGWFSVGLGSVVPKYGSLTVDNAQLFGIQVDAVPAQMRASATYGSLARAVPADTISGRPGSFERNMWAVRLGNESESGSRVGLTIAYMKDDEFTIPNLPGLLCDSFGYYYSDVDTNVLLKKDTCIPSPNPLMPLAQEGTSMGLDFKTFLSKKLYVGGEIAVCSFTRDKAAPELTDPLPIVSLLMTTRTSTRVDAAAKVEGGFKAETWGIDAYGLFVGPGFVVLTQPFFQPDRIEVNISPNLTLLDGKVIANASVGYRILDVSNTMTSGSSNLLLSANATVFVTDQLTISGSFTNFQYQQTRTTINQAYAQTSTSYGVMPSFSFSSGDFRHQLSGGITVDAFHDVQTDSINSSPNTTTSIVASYGITPIRSKWMARVSGNYVRNSGYISTISYTSLTATGSYRMFEGKLEPDASFTYSTNSVATLPSENQLTLHIGLRGHPVKSLTAFANFQLTSLNSDVSSLHRAYSETLLSVGVRWQF